jgi:hypothetical protein
MTDTLTAPEPTMTGLGDDHIKELVERYRKVLEVNRGNLIRAAAATVLDGEDEIGPALLDITCIHLDAVDLPLVIEITKDDLTYNLPEGWKVSDGPGDDLRPELGWYIYSPRSFCVMTNLVWVVSICADVRWRWTRIPV